jgi:hypothetical protein
MCPGVDLLSEGWVNEASKGEKQVHIRFVRVNETLFIKKTGYQTGTVVLNLVVAVDNLTCGGFDFSVPNAYTTKQLEWRLGEFYWYFETYHRGESAPIVRILPQPSLQTRQLQVPCGPR